jgi:hypothetical protein
MRSMLSSRYRVDGKCDEDRLMSAALETTPQIDDGARQWWLGTNGTTQGPFGGGSDKNGLVCPN